MTDKPEKPDFIGDGFGNVKDVRHLKYHKVSSLAEEYSTKQKVSSLPEEYPAKRNRKKKFEELIYKIISDMPGCLLIVLGGLLIIAGIALYMGNTGGSFPTFPYAGFLTMALGFAILAVAQKVINKSE